MQCLYVSLHTRKRIIILRHSHYFITSTSLQSCGLKCWAEVRLGLLYGHADPLHLCKYDCDIMFIYMCH